MVYSDGKGCSSWSRVGQLIFFSRDIAKKWNPRKRKSKGEGEKSLVLQRKGSLFFFSLGLVMWLLRGQSGEQTKLTRKRKRQREEEMTGEKRNKVGLEVKNAMSLIPIDE